MLLIDCHEPREIIDKLAIAVPTEILRLKYGDYSFSDTVIERKTLSDFFSSLKNNKLQEQMEYTSRFYTDKYLLIEGFFDFSYIKNIDYLYSQLIDIVLDFEVNVVFSKDMDQTVTILTRLYRQRNFKRPLNVLRKDKIYHAAKFFGISGKRLEILFSRFECIKNIANAEKKEFKKLKSIGKRTVEKVKDTLNSNIFD